MGTRRKLHARRGTDSEQIPAFTWATDRADAANSSSTTQQTQQQGRESVVAQPHQQQQQWQAPHQSQSAAAAPVQHVAPEEQAGFKWISDYLESADPPTSPGFAKPHSSSLQQDTQQHTVWDNEQHHKTVLQPAHAPAAQASHWQQQQQQPAKTSRAHAQVAARTQLPNQQQYHLQQHRLQQQQQALAGIAHATAAGVSSAAAAAADSAARASRWFSSTLDTLMGYDPAVASGVAAAPAPAAAGQGYNRLSSAAVSTEQRPQQQQAAGSQRAQPQQQQPQTQQQQPMPQPQQHPQQGPQPAGLSYGWVLAVLLGLAALASDAATAVVTAYTESVKPSAELLWQLSTALLLYLLLPLLRLLLAAVKLLLRCCGYFTRAGNARLGKLLQSHGAVQRRAQLKQLLPGGLQTNHNTASEGSQDQQQDQRQQQQQQRQQQPPDAFLCPISHDLMQDPVVARDGHTYDRKAITEWIQACGAGRAACLKSPMTLLPMKPTLVPNHSLKSLIRAWHDEQQRLAGGRD